MAETTASMGIATQSAQNRVPNFEGATTDATFPKLPFELRSRIWRYSFPPPRTIRLAADENPEFPVTLWINYESRTETLKYYVLFNKENLQDSGLSWARCFSPSRDMVSFNASSPLVHNDQSFIFLERLEFLDRDVRGVLGNFLKLEVTDFLLDIDFGFQLMLNYLKKYLLSFPGMKEITIVGKMVTDLELVDIQRIEICRKEIIEQVGRLQLAEDLKISFTGFEAD